MNGKEIYENYQKKRDFTGSIEDSYAQELQSIFQSIGGVFFNLLEEAHQKNKIVKIKEDSKSFDEISIDDLNLV